MDGGEEDDVVAPQRSDTQVVLIAVFEDGTCRVELPGVLSTVWMDCPEAEVEVEELFGCFNLWKRPIAKPATTRRNIAAHHQGCLRRHILLRFDEPETAPGSWGGPAKML